MATKVKLPPLPWAELPFNSLQWQDWFKDIRKLLAVDGFPWTAINFTGSNLTDILIRNHNDLQSIQGGQTGQFNHLNDVQHALLASAQTANKVLAGPATGAPAVPTYRALVTADLPAGTGTVTSVALTTPSEFTVSGSPITTSGTLAVTKATQSANTVWAGPTSGGATTPTFRALVPSDVPFGHLYDYQTPTTGFSYTIPAGVTHSILNPAGTLASGTITMPASPVDGQINTVSTSQTITALTVSANTGQSIGNTPTTLSAGTGFQYIYRSADTTWYRLY